MYIFKSPQLKEKICHIDIEITKIPYTTASPVTTHTGSLESLDLAAPAVGLMPVKSCPAQLHLSTDIELSF